MYDEQGEAETYSSNTLEALDQVGPLFCLLKQRQGGAKVGHIGFKLGIVFVFLVIWVHGVDPRRSGTATAAKARMSRACVRERLELERRKLLCEESSPACLGAPSRLVILT